MARWPSHRSPARTPAPAPPRAAPPPDPYSLRSCSWRLLRCGAVDCGGDGGERHRLGVRVVAGRYPISLGEQIAEDVHDAAHLLRERCETVDDEQRVRVAKQLQPHVHHDLAIALAREAHLSPASTTSIIVSRGNFSVSSPSTTGAGVASAASAFSSMAIIAQGFVQNARPSTSIPCV